MGCDEGSEREETLTVDGTAGNVPSPSVKSKDGRYYRGRRARQPETIMCGGA